MSKEVKIEDFISSKELEKMSGRERKIYEQAFLLNKQNLQNLTDSLKFMDDLNEKLNNKIN